MTYNERRHRQICKFRLFQQFMKVFLPVNRQFCRNSVLTARFFAGIVTRCDLLGYSVTVARLTLDQLVGVRIPVPQLFLLWGLTLHVKEQVAHEQRLDTIDKRGGSA